MSETEPFEIFCPVPPGLEPMLQEECCALGLPAPRLEAGGVAFDGGWEDVWRANLGLRGATRVLARIGSFRAFHLAQLDKRARKFDWGAVLRPDIPISVEVTCRKSRIYHDRAAAQRITGALEAAGYTVKPRAPVTLRARIEDDLCSFSVDTSGAPLHKRGHKQAVGKAPLRETMAALFLRAAGFDGSEPVLDPMCGSGTFVIEAAEWAAGLAPGRDRSFAFERLAGFKPEAFAALKSELTPEARATDLLFHGSDRDAGAITGAEANAARAGIGDLTRFAQHPVSALTRPEGPAGLVMVNPPYGARIGNKGLLFALHGALGEVLRAQFSGWRVGIVTSDGALARATGLPLSAGPIVPHGGLKVRLWSGPITSE